MVYGILQVNIEKLRFLVHLTRSRLIKDYINSYLEQADIEKAKDHTIWRDRLGHQSAGRGRLAAQKQ
jgi:hypothetical protein